MRIFFLLAFFALSTSTWAQSQPFEKNWFSLEGKEPSIEELSFNPLTDVVTVRRSGGEVAYSAAEVLHFVYEDYLYYSLPLNNSFSFFRVLHESNGFAVLHKQTNHQLLEYFVSQSEGALQICEDEDHEGKLVLCEQQIGPSFGMPGYTGASVAYSVEDAVFLAIKGSLHLVNFKYDTRGQLFAAVPSLQKKNRRTLKRLKEVVDNEQKMQQLRRYVATASADLQDPEQLILALKTIYP